MFLTLRWNDNLTVKQLAEQEGYDPMQRGSSGAVMRLCQLGIHILHQLLSLYAG
jgi:hypothetical protein